MTSVVITAVLGEVDASALAQLLESMEVRYSMLLLAAEDLQLLPAPEAEPPASLYPKGRVGQAPGRRNGSRRLPHELPLGQAIIARAKELGGAITQQDAFEVSEENGYSQSSGCICVGVMIKAGLFLRQGSRMKPVWVLVKDEDGNYVA